MKDTVKKGGRKPRFTESECDEIRSWYRQKGESVGSTARVFRCTPGVIDRVLNGTYTPRAAEDVPGTINQMDPQFAQLVQNLLTAFDALDAYLLNADQGLLLEFVKQDKNRYQYFLQSQGTVLHPCHAVMTPIPEMQEGI